MKRWKTERVAVEFSTINKPKSSRSCRASFKNLGQNLGQEFWTKSWTKIWDKNFGQQFGTDGQTDRRTDRTRYRVTPQLKSDLCSEAKT